MIKILIFKIIKSISIIFPIIFVVTLLIAIVSFKLLLKTNFPHNLKKLIFPNPMQYDIKDKKREIVGIRVTNIFMFVTGAIVLFSFIFGNIVGWISSGDFNKVNMPAVTIPFFSCFIIAQFIIKRYYKKIMRLHNISDK